MLQGDKTEKIGLMFGSFNPPHLGHLITAKKAKFTHNFSEIWLLPVPVSAFKKGDLQATFNQKVDMCNILASDDSTWLKTSGLCAGFEDGVVEQLQSYKRLMEKLSIERPDVEFNVVAGQDFNNKLKIAVASMCYLKLISEAVNKAVPVNSVMLKQLADRVSNAYEVMSSIPMVCSERSQIIVDGVAKDVSSSEIKRDLQSGMEDIDALPSGVQDYIKSNNLYVKDFGM